MEYAFFLGANPALSALELWYRFHDENNRTSFDMSLLPKLILMKSDSVNILEKVASLGGTPFAGCVAARLNALDAEQMISELKLTEKIASSNKHLLGISFISQRKNPALITPKDVRQFGMKIKKTVRVKGLRLILPQDGTSLSSAQIYNENIIQNGLAINIIEETSGSYLIIILKQVQDIAFYTKRDRERPESDPGKGMLPVKLAQIYLNLASIPLNGKIYDPFCGVGTIAAEALLSGYKISASDISPRQVERTKKNLEWLNSVLPEKKLDKRIDSLFTHDVQKPIAEIADDSLDAIVSEGWLGPALMRESNPYGIEKTFFETQTKLFALLYHARNKLKSGGVVLISLPAFRIGKRIVRAPFLQEEFRKDIPSPFILDSLVPDEWHGFPVFRDSLRGQALYGRPDALVLRDIVRFKKHGL